MTKIKNDRRWLWQVTLAAMIAAALLITFIACREKPPSPGSVSTDPSPAGCADSTALAAVDLSGHCRCTPQASMGALEAVGGCA